MKTKLLVTSLISCLFVTINNAQTTNKSNVITNSGNNTQTMGVAGTGPGGGDTVVTIADRVTFAYDESGNQTERKLCINCTVNKNALREKNNLIAKEDEIFSDDNLKFYPNPLTEDLFIDFNITDKNKKVEHIEVISLDGQIVKLIKDINENETLKIPFDDMPQGVYIVNVAYSNGEIVDLKIVKK